MSKYFTLLTRDDATSRWGIQFGDYSRANVEAEARDAYRETKAANRRIICTGAEQSDIDAAVAELNKEHDAVAKQIEMSDLERKARFLLQVGVYNKTPEQGWTNDKALVALVFKSMWHASMPIERINQIGAAMIGLREPSDLTEACEALVKERILRIVRQRGERRYEVNY